MPKFSPILLSFFAGCGSDPHPSATSGTASRVTLNGAAPAQRCAACRAHCSVGIARRAALHEWMPPGRAASRASPSQPRCRNCRRQSPANDVLKQVRRRSWARTKLCRWRRRRLPFMGGLPCSCTRHQRQEMNMPEKYNTRSHSHERVQAVERPRGVLFSFLFLLLIGQVRQISCPYAVGCSGAVREGSLSF